MKKVKKIEKTCHNCGFHFNVRMKSKDSNKFCSYKCYWEYLKTIPSNRLGEKASDATKKKLSDSHIGIQAQERHPNWKGGLTSLVLTIRHSLKYKQWRKNVFTRDNYICQICGGKNGLGKSVYLEADHYPALFSEIFYKNNIKSVEESVLCEELWDINNGRTLCLECHRKYGRRK